MTSSKTSDVRALFWSMLASISNASPALGIAPHFRKYHQEDAHEFLRFIVDKLQVDAQGGEQYAHPLFESSSDVKQFAAMFRTKSPRLLGFTAYLEENFVLASHAMNADITVTRLTC